MICGIIVACSQEGRLLLAEPGNHLREVGVRNLVILAPQNSIGDRIRWQILGLGLLVLAGLFRIGWRGYRSRAGCALAGRVRLGDHVLAVIRANVSVNHRI
jgi:hypothetical protein